MKILNLDAYNKTALQHDPFDYMIVPGFINEAYFNRLVEDFPKINKPGSFPLTALSYGPMFESFLKELKAPAFTAIVGEKFSVDLHNKPMMFSVRGKCSRKDGKTHTDSKSKIISMLIYMNSSWDKPEGKLRILRSSNLEDTAAEIPPVAGTMLMFRRADNSWHGHPSFEGNRQVVQVNWVTDQKYVEHEQNRHGFSALLKKLWPSGY